jgi:hypothetical protein
MVAETIEAASGVSRARMGSRSASRGIYLERTDWRHASRTVSVASVTAQRNTGDGKAFLKVSPAGAKRHEVV